MSEGTNLPIRMEAEDSIQPVSMNPTLAMAQAQKAATALKKFVKDTGCLLQISGNDYIKVEAWQTVGSFYGLTSRPAWTRAIEVGGASGWESRVEVVNAEGRVVSAAEAMCLNDEPNWKNRPQFQLRSMAQTRAVSKSFRNVLAWVVTMAGYAPTPAEEMDGVKPQPPAPNIQPRDEARACPKDGNMMTFKTGITKSGKNAGKPWAGWFCSDRDHPVQWVKIEDETQPTPQDKGAPNYEDDAGGYDGGPTADDIPF